MHALEREANFRRVKVGGVNGGRTGQPAEVKQLPMRGIGGKPGEVEALIEFEETVRIWREWKFTERGGVVRELDGPIREKRSLVFDGMVPGRDGQFGAKKPGDQPRTKCR